MSAIRTVNRERSWGDTAVDGLLAGIMAGAVMMVYLMVVAWIDGGSPLEMAGRFDAMESGSAVVGILLHLATSAVYGIFFALGYRIIGGRWRYDGLVLGAAYGLLLWLLADAVLLGMVDSPLLQIPAYFFSGHIAYGLVLGGWLGREVQ